MVWYGMVNVDLYSAIITAELGATTAQKTRSGRPVFWRIRLIDLAAEMWLLEQLVQLCQERRRSTL